MDLHVRQCCCALHTFVRLICIFLILVHLLTAVLASVWHWMATTANSIDEFPQDDDPVRDQSNNRLAAVVLGVVLFFSACGVTVNALALYGIRSNRRTLIIPWLVFQLLVIIGLFATGLYVALRFTVLIPVEEQETKSSKAYAVLCLFPLVSGIFLIFAWILTDQLFIQMKTLKSLGVRSVSSSNLSQLRKNLVMTPARPSSVAASSQQGTVRSLSKLKVHPQQQQVIHHHHHPQQQPQQYLPPQQQQQQIVYPILFSGHYHQQYPLKYGYHTQSLPRPVGREKRHKIREFSYKVDMDSLRGGNKGKQTKKRRMRRAKSLEQILGQGSSSNASSTSSTSGGASNSDHSNNNPNVWVVDGVRHHQHPLASYCTIDRARLRRPRQDSISNGEDTANLTLPRKKTTPPKKPPRSHSLEMLDQDGSPAYIGDLGGEMDELRQATLERGARAKSVTIHPDVTEFHYPEESHDGVSSTYDSLPPPPPPLFSEPQDLMTDEHGNALPPPPPPPSQQLGPEQIQQNTKTWLQKLSAPLTGGAKAGTLTKDEIIGFYCQQAGDVQL